MPAQPIPQSLPAPTCRRDAGLVHAPGRPLHERIPRAARALLAARPLPNARSRHRSHAAAGAPHRRRRGDPLLRSPAAARADGHPLRLRPRRRPGDREPAAQRGRHRRASGRSSRARRSRYVLDAIRQIKRELGGRVPLIGFAGAPFTLASYAIEGGHSNNFAQTKALMYGAPAAWHRLCDTARRRDRRLPRRADRSRRRRGAGVRLVGRRAERRATIASSSCRTRDASSSALAQLGVPTIHFGVGTGAILAELREAGGDVIGADWRMPLDEAWERIGLDRGDPGQSRPDAAARPARSHASPRPTTCSSAPAAGPATSSISDTASCRRRRSNTSRRSRDTCIRKRSDERDARRCRCRTSSGARHCARRRSDANGTSAFC